MSLELKGIHCPHKVMYHYTDEAGYAGILRSGVIRPSVLEGIKSTHYGRGVYLTPLGPAEIPIIGAHEFLARTFNDATAHSVARTTHYLELRVDPHWYAMAAVDPKHGWVLDDIWVVPGDGDMEVSACMVGHGKTPVGRELDAMADRGTTAARDYAYQLNLQHQHRHDKPAEDKQQVWEPSDYVFIGGHTVRRPRGWYEDAPSWVGPEMLKAVIKKREREGK